ncbi:DUF1801 domain-containing protein [Sphingomonas yantingensis]|uniref:YdhG-like domain-containing protein n=1 Tax=Sphingomonas yantingensis TaxID=1241761 RepID=A0A7W9EGN0_9SPHN|nr:DUF1801 domain-containing protein [Sphingomonas yantingensis]MBB5697094.1 hypothetical protein [Sphingomonas yantingensis]
MTNRTTASDADVDAFIDAVSDPVRREDARAVRALYERVSGEPARMWGSSIVGCGEYAYRASGKDQRMCSIGFSPRKAETVLYLAQDFPGKTDLLAQLGPHRTGVGCVYVKRLDKIDAGVLERLVAAAFAALQATG